MSKYFKSPNKRLRKAFLLLFSFSIIGVPAQDYLSILDSLEQQLTITEESDPRMKILSECLKNSLYNDLDKAFDYVLRFEKEALASNDSVEIARSKNFFGMHASTAGDHFRAITEYEDAMDWYTALEDTFMMGMMLNNIGGAYEFQADRKNSIRYFKEASVYFKAAQQEDWVFFTKFNLAGQYLAENRLLEAEPLLQEALLFFGENGYDSYVGEALMSLGEIAMSLDGPQEALDLLLQIEDGQMEDRSTQARLQTLYCRIYTTMKDPEKAEPHCRDAISQANKFGAQDRKISAYEAMYAFLKEKGDYAEALVFHEGLMNLNDSVVKAMKDKQLINMLTKYEIREKEKELGIRDLQLEQRTNVIRIILLAISVILIGGLIFLYSRVKTNQKLRAQKEMIESSLSEKELLLREIHHRVKNNLQVVSSILSIQSRGITDERALKAVNESRSRVRSMALIHQDLYSDGNLEGINARQYITKLSNSLFNSYRVDVDRVQLITEVDDLLIDVDTSVPIGLILNELITNSLKYAFPNERSGEIRVVLREKEDSLQLIVQDNGIGIPEEKKAASEDSFGMKMIKAFSKKLDATWEIRSLHGTTVELEIKNYRLAG